MESRIRQALREVLDPEYGINVVDLGLIYGIQERPDEVILTMTLTSRDCAMGGTLMQDVENCVARVAGKSVRLNMVWEPAWHPHLMSQEAVRILRREQGMTGRL